MRFWKCRHCSRMCHSLAHRKRHNRCLHSGKRPYGCPACIAKRFKRDDRLVKHLKTVHYLTAEQVVASYIKKNDKGKKHKKNKKDKKTEKIKSFIQT